jgi:hypothetical protein
MKLDITYEKKPTPPSMMKIAKTFSMSEIGKTSP